MNTEMYVYYSRQRNRESLIGKPRVLAFSDEIIPVLTAMRKINGVTQVKISKLGISQSGISEIENSKVGDNYFRTMLKYVKGVDNELGIGLIVSGEQFQLLAVGEGIIPTARAIREELNLSAEKLAENMRTSQSAITNLELRKVDPKMTTLLRYITEVHPQLRIALIDSRA